VKLFVFLPHGPSEMLISQWVVQPLQIVGSRITRQPPYGRRIVDEKIDSLCS
jgi:hypothetical protein